MSKALEIRKAIAARVASLGTVIRGRRVFNKERGELPGLNVFMEPRTVSESSGNGTRYIIDSQTTIEYHKELSGDADDQGDAMLIELRALVEVEPRRLGELVLAPGISFAGDDIEHPDAAGGVVKVAVTYNTPHVDQFG